MGEKEDWVEYLDGARPELIREMMEPDVMLPVKKKRVSCKWGNENGETGSSCQAKRE